MRITVIDFDNDDTATVMSAISAALERDWGNRKGDREPDTMKGPPVTPPLGLAPGEPRNRGEAIILGAPLEVEAGPPAILSPQLADTWRYLVAHDTAAGLSTNEVANGLQLKPATAGYRLSRLLRDGLVHRVKRSHYRAGER